MNYELYFFCLLFFLIGRVSVTFSFYIGSNEEKYKAATIGILIEKQIK